MNININININTNININIDIYHVSTIIMVLFYFQTQIYPDQNKVEKRSTSKDIVMVQVCGFYF